MKIKPGLVYFIGSLGGLLFGIDSGLTGGIMSPARHALNFDAGWEVIMANAVTFGAGIMALFAGVLNDKYGRKKMLVSSSLVFIVGAGLCSFAWDGLSLTLSRVVLGLGIGIASATVPAFLAELAPAVKRSGIATLFQFAIVIGLNIAYVVDYLILPAGDNHPFAWMQHSFQMMLGFALIPSVLLFLFALLMPESPRFLARQGNITEAKAVLLGMRHGNQADADKEFAEIEQVINEPTGGVKDLLTYAKKPLIAALGLAFMQQLVGINAALYYGPIIGSSVWEHPYKNPTAGSAHWIANLQQDQVIAIIFGVVNVLATIVTVLIMNKIASYKKTLYLGGGIMCFFSILFVIQVNTNFLPPIGAIIMVCLYIVGFAFSWGPLTWNILGEIFPLSVRGIGAALGASCNWFSNFIVMSVFGIIILKDANGDAQHVDYGFALFAFGCILAIAFTYFVIPETKGKSLEELEEGFRAEKSGSGDNIALGAIVGSILISLVVIIVMTMGSIVSVPLAWSVMGLCIVAFIVAIIAVASGKKK